MNARKPCLYVHCEPVKWASGRVSLDAVIVCGPFAPSGSNHASLLSSETPG